MLEKLKEALEKIREKRTEELKRYVPFSDNEYQKRKALLSAELPYKTDSASVLDVLGKIYISKEKKRSEKIKKDAREIVKEWCASASDASQREREMFCQRLKNAGILKYEYDSEGTTKPISDQHLHRVLPYELMERFISNLPDLEPSSRKTYFYYAQSLYEFLVKDLSIAPILRRYDSGVSLYDLAKLFEYLEERALKSTTTRSFSDLIICRAICYTSLPANELFTLGLPDKVKLCLVDENTSYPVPKSFITLWECLGQTDRMFPRKFDGNQLHKKIRRLGTYAELSVKLTPTDLRTSLKSIYNKALFIDPEIALELPRR